MKILTLVFSALWALMSLQVQAIESSCNDTADLNFCGTITLIDGDGDGQVDDLSIDSFSFTVIPDGTVSVTATTGFDSFIFLFDSNNTVLISETSNEGSSNPFNLDAGFDIELLPGTYTGTIGLISNASEALQGYDADKLFSGDGDWYVAIELPPSPVPLPAGLPLFMSALIGLGLFRRK